MDLQLPSKSYDKVMHPFLRDLNAVVLAVNRNNNCPFSIHDLSLGFYQRVTLRVSHGEQKLLTHLEAQRSPSVFSGLLFAVN
jgi:hypothetical protein